MTTMLRALQHRLTRDHRRVRGDDPTTSVPQRPRSRAQPRPTLMHRRGAGNRPDDGCRPPWRPRLRAPGRRASATSGRRGSRRRAMRARRKASKPASGTAPRSKDASPQPHQCAPPPHGPVHSRGRSSCPRCAPSPAGRAHAPDGEGHLRKGRIKAPGAHPRRHRLADAFGVPALRCAASASGAEAPTSRPSYRRA